MKPRRTIALAACGAALIAAPEALGAPGLANPLGRLDDTVSDLATYAYWAGVRAGAAAGPGTTTVPEGVRYVCSRTSVRSR